MRAYRGTKLTAEQAKQALEVQLLNQARLDIFGAFAPTHIGRTGRKEIKKGLKGPRLTSYYPIRDRPHKVMPKIDLHKGLLEFMETLQFAKTQSAGAAGEGKEATGDEDEAEEQVKKLSNQVTADDRNLARFKSLMKQAVADLRAKGDFTTTEDDEALILKIVQENFMTEKDKKMDEKEIELLQAEQQKTSQADKISFEKSEQNVLDLAKALSEGRNIDEAAAASSATAGAESGAAVAAPAVASGTARPQLRAQLNPTIVLEHQINRAMSQINAAQQSGAVALNPLARKLQEMSMAPEANIAQLLYGPKFLHTNPDENYYLTPHSRQLSASQLAEEVRASERRQRLLCKTLDVAPQELPAFRVYCEQAAKSLYADGNSQQQKRFAAALKQLSDPAVCMQLGEQELQAEQEEGDAIVRLVVVDNKITADTAPEALRQRAATEAQRNTKAVQSKLLTRSEADSDVIKAAKGADASDRAMFVAMEKFAASGPKALTDAAEKTAVLRALLRQLDEEEAMYEAIELQELSVRQLTPVTMMQLQSLKKNLTGAAPMDFTDSQSVSAADMSAWTRAVLSLSADKFASLQALVQKVETLACSRRDALQQAAQLGAADVKDAEALRAQADSAAAEQRTVADQIRSFVVGAKIVARDEDGFNCTAQLLKAVGDNSIANLRLSLEFALVSALRQVAGLTALPVTALHWEAAAASVKADSTFLTATDARLLAAMKVWAADSRVTTTMYEPFHPYRRRLIALRHQQAVAADDDARLALFHERQQQHHAEVQQAVKVRTQGLDSIREHAALAYIQRAWKPTGGYLSPEDDDWEKQQNDVKEMNKFKSSKKGEGKRGKKK